MVHITKMTFINYCVDLYRRNVQPMLAKLKRRTSGDIQWKTPMGGSPQGGARRGKVLLNKDAVKDLKIKGKEGGKGDPNNFLSKIDVLRQRHGVQLLKINQLHIKDDEEADAALDDSERRLKRDRLIMEEEKYYENLDERKFEDEGEQ